MDYKKSKQKFLKIYANLPMGIRDEIIVVLDDGKTLTWNSAFVEINSDTDLSKIILKKLEITNII